MLRAICLQFRYGFLLSEVARHKALSEVTACEERTGVRFKSFSSGNCSLVEHRARWKLQRPALLCKCVSCAKDKCEAAREEFYAAERCRRGSDAIGHDQFSPAQLDMGYRWVARNIITPCGGTSA